MNNRVCRTIARLQPAGIGRENPAVATHAPALSIAGSEDFPAESPASNIGIILFALVPDDMLNRLRVERPFAKMF